MNSPGARWARGPSGRPAAGRPGATVGDRCHLVVDALQVHQPGVPELKLDPGQRVQPIQQHLGRVFAQHVPDLVGPVDDYGFDGMQQRVVQGGRQPARQGGRCFRPPGRVPAALPPPPRPPAGRPWAPTSSPASPRPMSPGPSSQPAGEAGGSPKPPRRRETLSTWWAQLETSAPPSPEREYNVQDGPSWQFWGHTGHILGLSGPRRNGPRGESPSSRPLT